MFRPLLWSVGSGTHRSIAVLIVMNVAATGVVITIVIDSIAFPASVGTAASTDDAKPNRKGRRRDSRRDRASGRQGVCKTQAFPQRILRIRYKYHVACALQNHQAPIGCVGLETRGTPLDPPVLIGDIGLSIGLRLRVILIVIGGDVVFSTDVERWDHDVVKGLSSSHDATAGPTRRATC